ncbi:MAG: MFS transporter [Haloarculaceae archaeon]
MAPSNLLRRFPPAVLATAFATFVAFLGIGVVDPVLPSIAETMGASHAMVELLFTSYILVMSVTMLVSGSLSTRLSAKTTMLLGLGLVAVFAGLCGLAPSVPALAVLRGGWGLGNALFTTTALAIIVGVSTEGTTAAVTLFEAALGLGIAAGPLVGGFLGAQSWRYPFFATSTLMVIGFAVTALAVSNPDRDEQRRTVRDVIGAFNHPAVLVNALVGLGYSFAFFVVLAYSPLALDVSSMQLGVTFFGWGALVAICSVFVANRLVSRFGAVTTMVADLAGFALLLGVMSLTDGTTLLWLVVLTGAFCGVANATLTTLAMRVSPYSRSVSSAAYNSLRWAGAAFAPVIAGYVGGHYGATTPFLMGAVVVAAGVVALLASASVLRSSLSVPNASHGD